MKTSKSPESTEMTPSKKKLKQARLPFKLLSDVAPSTTAPQTRKRKLSAPELDTVTKIGKISKENDLAEDLVVISDDDSKDGSKQHEDKPLNPFVKLVDNVWKKKLQKSKKSKKLGQKDKSVSPKQNVNVCLENLNENVSDTTDDKDVEMTDITVLKQTEDNVNSVVNKNTTDSEVSFSSTSTSLRENNTVTKYTEIAESDKKVNDVVILDDSNNCSDVILTESSLTKNNCQLKQTKLSDSKDIESNINHGSLPKNDKESEDSSPKHPVTPKRSTRNKLNKEEKNNLDSSTSSLNISVSSVTTPKNNRSLSVTNSLEEDTMNDSSTGSNNLTPKQVQKKLESAKKKEERERERQERDRKKQQEKEERARQRQEKEEQKKREREEKEEAKRKDKEEKEEQKRKEREDKERQKELEKKLKEEKEEQKRKEREEKEEQRKKEKEAREEEKRKKQEALELERQEQELKKKKAAEAFVNFFVPKQKIEKDHVSSAPLSKNSLLSSFTIKVDMRLAPTTRIYFNEEKRQELDNLLEEQNLTEDSLYLKSLKRGVKTASSGKTWPLSDKDEDDVIIVEDELPPIDGADEIMTCEPAVREKLRPKLLSFHDNRRPPYWGTWRKKSAFIKPRRPLGQDNKLLEYEVDSDDEWEEEQEGESIDGSVVGSDEEQDADEYEVDNEVFVPHGYLSDEEATMDEDDVLSLSPEAQKAKLKHLEDEFESEMKKPTEKLKPRLYGLLWETSEGGKPEKCVDALWNYFRKLSMIMNDPTKLLQPSDETEEVEKKVKKKKTANGDQPSPSSDRKKKAKYDNKDKKTLKSEPKKNTTEQKKNQPVINSFLTKLKAPLT